MQRDGALVHRRVGVIPQTVIIGVVLIQDWK